MVFHRGAVVFMPFRVKNVGYPTKIPPKKVHLRPSVKCIYLTAPTNCDIIHAGKQYIVLGSVWGIGGKSATDLWENSYKETTSADFLPFAALSA